MCRAYSELLYSENELIAKEFNPIQKYFIASPIGISEVSEHITRMYITNLKKTFVKDARIKKGVDINQGQNLMKEELKNVQVPAEY